MMILFVKLTKGIGHKFYQLMRSSPINWDIVMPDKIMVFIVIVKMYNNTNKIIIN
jgi:hypothetical protein